MKNRSLLSAQPDRFLQFFTVCHYISSRISFSSTVYPLLKEFLPHTHFLCGVASIYPQVVLDSINIGFADPSIINQLAISALTYETHSGTNTEPKLPLYIDENTLGKTVVPVQSWQPSILKKNGISNLMVHGIREIHGGATSYFCLSDVGPDTPETRHLLKLITPHLHAALCGHYSLKNIHQKDCGVSNREKEILELVRIGKTNQEIGMILGISAWTVKNHVQNLMAKLEVSTRGHAVVKATNMGLFSA